MLGIGSVLGSLFGIVKDGIASWRETKKAKHDMSLAEIENKARLLRDKEANNHEWEMASLTDKDKWVRRTSFIIFCAPFIVAIFAPDHVKTYFDTAISAIPAWFRDVFVSINGAIWGLSALKNPLSQVISAWKDKKSN